MYMYMYTDDLQLARSGPYASKPFMHGAQFSFLLCRCQTFSELS